MSKQPAFQFYPGDWRKDPNLSRASLSAKGAMIEIMCLAFECEKRGVLKTGGKPWTIDDIAMAIGGNLENNKSAIQELLDKKILKKDRKNAIFSQRMCRDEKIRKIRREAGSKGGNPNLLNQNSNQSANQKSTPSSSSSSSSSDIKKEKEIFLGIVSGSSMNPENDYLVPSFLKIWLETEPGYFVDKTRDYHGINKIIRDLSTRYELDTNTIYTNKISQHVLKLKWTELVKFIHNHTFFKKYSISQVSEKMQEILKNYNIEYIPSKKQLVV